MTPLTPDLMTAEERIAELGEILARGFVRLRARKSRAISADRGESCVDFAGEGSGHGAATKPRQAGP
jgi:hypothetical protein